MALTLYHFESCPACEKVRLALALDRRRYESVEIDRDDRRKVNEVSGQQSVPVLVDGDDVYVESTRILEHLASRKGSTLLPASRRTQGLTRMLVDRADSHLAALFYRLKRRRDPDGKALRDDDLEILRRKLDDEMAVIEGLLEGGPFLFGDHPTLADLSVHAYLNRLDRAGGLAIPDELVRVRGWYSRVAEAAGRR